jgi:hypothetical protein
MHYAGQLLYIIWKAVYDWLSSWPALHAKWRIYHKLADAARYNGALRRHIRISITVNYCVMSPH